MKGSILLINIFIFCLAGCAGLNQNTSSSGDSLSSFKLNLNAKKFVLDNGLKVIISENRKLPIFSFLTFYEFGTNPKRLKLK